MLSGAIIGLINDNQLNVSKKWALAPIGIWATYWLAPLLTRGFNNLMKVHTEDQKQTQ